jgi:nucleotide-binding universal stress UspA family protein
MPRPPSESVPSERWAAKKQKKNTSNVLHISSRGPKLAAMFAHFRVKSLGIRRTGAASFCLRSVFRFPRKQHTVHARTARRSNTLHRKQASMKVMVALDGSENAYDALRRALELTKPEDSLLLVHTVEEMHPAPVPITPPPHSPSSSPSWPEPHSSPRGCGHEPVHGRVGRDGHDGGTGEEDHAASENHVHRPGTKKRGTPCPPTTHVKVVDWETTKRPRPCVKKLTKAIWGDRARWKRRSPSRRAPERPSCTKSRRGTSPIVVCVYARACAVVGAGSDQTCASCAIAREVELVCMGSRGLGGVSKALLGSTSSYLLQHAPAGCSILVIKQDGAS